MAVVGVYRTIKFVKYLREFGWEPIVLTLRNPRDYAFNPELFKDIPSDIKVHRTRLFQPLQSWENWTARRRKALSSPSESERTSQSVSADPSESSPSLVSQIKQHLYAGLSTPDKDAGWMLTALPKTLQIVRREKVDCLYTSTPPHSSHLIGLYAKELTGLPFVADFRAPWTQNEYFDDIKKIAWQRRLEERLERSVHKGAEIVISNSTWEGDGYRAKYGPQVGDDKFYPILNGYDPEDFNPMGAIRYDKFTIVYIGSLYKRRSPELFLEGLRRFVDMVPGAREKTRVLFIGPSEGILQIHAERLNLVDLIERINFLPQSEAYKYLFGAHLLLMILGFDSRGKGVIPAKIFEYLPTGRPSLALIPEGETAEMLRKYDGGTIVTAPDAEQVARGIDVYYQQYLRDPIVIPRVRVIEEYTRRYQTSQLASLLDLAIAKKNKLRG